MRSLRETHHRNHLINHSSQLATWHKHTAQFFLSNRLASSSPPSLPLSYSCSLSPRSLRETCATKSRERERDHVVDELLEHGGGGAATGVPVPPEGRRAHLRLPRAQARRQGRVLRPPPAHGRRRSQQGWAMGSPWWVQLDESPIYIPLKFWSFCLLNCSFLLIAMISFTKLMGVHRERERERERIPYCTKRIL